MNIFILSPDMRKSAEMLFSLDKRRANKQIVEIAQCVSAATTLLFGTSLSKKDGSPYSLTHQSHPCTKWIRTSYINLASSIQYGVCLCDEYNKITGKEHGCRRPLKFAMYLTHLMCDTYPNCPVTPTTGSFSDMPRFGKAMPNTGNIFNDCLQHIKNKQNKEGN